MYIIIFITGTAEASNKTCSTESLSNNICIFNNSNSNINQTVFGWREEGVKESDVSNQCPYRHELNKSVDILGLYMTCKSIFWML